MRACFYCTVFACAVLRLAGSPSAAAQATESLLGLVQGMPTNTVSMTVPSLNNPKVAIPMANVPQRSTALLPGPNSPTAGIDPAPPRPYFMAPSLSANPRPLHHPVISTVTVPPQPAHAPASTDSTVIALTNLNTGLVIPLPATNAPAPVRRAARTDDPWLQQKQPSPLDGLKYHW